MNDRRRPKRDLPGVVLRLADMRKKAEEDEAKSLVITQRLTLASMFILLAVALLSFVFKEKILKDNYFIMYTIAGITLL